MIRYCDGRWASMELKSFDFRKDGAEVSPVWASIGFNGAEVFRLQKDRTNHRDLIATGASMELKSFDFRKNSRSNQNPATALLQWS